MSDLQRLIQLLSAEHHCLSISTTDEEEALALVRHAAMELSRDCVQWSVTTGVRDGLVAQSATVADTEHPAGALLYLARRPGRCIAILLDVAGHLKDERTLRCLREMLTAFEQSRSTVVLIDHADALPPVIESLATPFELTLPDEKELESLVKQTLKERNERRRIEVDINRPAFDAIVRNLRGLSRRQAKRIILDTVCEDHRFSADDLNVVLAKKRRHLQKSGVLEYVEAPVSLDQIGGLGRLKQWLDHRKNALSDDAARFGIDAPRGVLMLGVQGAGKSLSAKAVATAWQRPLLRLDPGSLYDRYIGESEKRLREALHQAEMMAPIILWIDEIEKGFASAASQSSDGGLSKRMFGALLTWMQEHTAPVFLIATANDIEALPPELLRKGRFDEIFFVDLPTVEAREHIFRIHLSRRGRKSDAFDIPALASAAEGFSGAEIEQAVLAALHEAYAARQEVSNDHLLQALKHSPPLSVTMAERIDALRQWARGRCVPAD